MTQSIEHKCEACGLIFTIDLSEEEIRFCPLCGYSGVKAVTIVADKKLCAECAGKQEPRKTEQQFFEEFSAALREELRRED